MVFRSTIRPLPNHWPRSSIRTAGKRTHVAVQAATSNACHDPEGNVPQPTPQHDLGQAFGLTPFPNPNPFHSTGTHRELAWGWLRGPIYVLSALSGSKAGRLCFDGMTAGGRGIGTGHACAGGRCRVPSTIKGTNHHAIPPNNTETGTAVRAGAGPVGVCSGPAGAAAGAASSKEQEQVYAAVLTSQHRTQS